MKLFELFATLSLDTSEFDEGVKAAKSTAEGLGSSQDKVTAKAVALGNAMYDTAKRAGHLVIDLGRDMVEAAAEIEAENAQFSSTFGDMSDEAAAAFDRVGGSANILAGRLRSVGMKEFAQFKGSGMDATKALAAMEALLSLSADAAAYYDISLEDADERIRSFLRGNVEAGDAIGLFTNALQRDEKALHLYGLEWKSLNEEQRQTVMFSIASEIYAQMGAIGQAAAEANNYRNIIGNLQRAWTELLAELGGPILKAITPAIVKLTEFLQENPEVIEKLGEVFGTLASTGADALINLMTWLSENSEAILGVFEGIVNAVTTIVQALGGNYETTATVHVAVDAPTAMAGADGAAANLGWNIGWWLRNLFSGNKEPEGKAVGLDYVPYNEFPALLHEGEAVLTKSEANAWRKGGGEVSAGGMDPAALAAAVRSALADVVISMDGKTVGRMVSGEVSKQINRDAVARRYTK